MNDSNSNTTKTLSPKKVLQPPPSHCPVPFPLFDSFHTKNNGVVVLHRTYKCVWESVLVVVLNRSNKPVILHRPIEYLLDPVVIVVLHAPLNTTTTMQILQQNSLSDGPSSKNLLPPSTTAPSATTELSSQSKNYMPDPSSQLNNSSGPVEQNPIFSPTTQDSAAALLVQKCCRRGCKDTTSVLVKCEVDGCDCYMHFFCFEAFYIIGKNYNPLPDNNVACTKRHYNKVMASIDGTLRLMWNNDRCKGPDDPIYSERLLLEWLFEPGNYARYRGKSNHGTTKLQFAHQIATHLNTMKVRVQRDQIQVLNKIAHLEDQFRCAFDFSNNQTGQGLMRAGLFDDKVLKICPYYHELGPIMCDRASAKPKVTSEDLESLSDSDKCEAEEENEKDSQELEEEGDDEEDGENDPTNLNLKRKKHKKYESQGYKYNSDNDKDANNSTYTKDEDSKKQEDEEEKEAQEKTIVHSGIK